MKLLRVKDLQITCKETPLQFQENLKLITSFGATYLLLLSKIRVYTFCFKEYYEKTFNVCSFYLESTGLKLLAKYSCSVKKEKFS